MSLHEDVTVLCEGVANGPDVRLLETARQSLRHSFPLADRIVITPAGSSADLAPSIRAYRRLRGVPFVFAIRDRDFLRREPMEQHRATAVGIASEPVTVRAWPLSRHSIESYLLEPSFIAAAMGVEIEAHLAAFARERRWLDVARATLEDGGYRLRRTRGELPDETPADMGAAMRLVRESLVEWAARAQAALDPAQAKALLDAFDRDFRDDGPEWTRVHGKRLLGRVEEHLRSVRRVLPPTVGLRDHLLRHAERHEPPAPLIDDLGAFFERIGSALAAA